MHPYLHYGGATKTKQSKEKKMKSKNKIILIIH